VIRGLLPLAAAMFSLLTAAPALSQEAPVDTGSPTATATPQAQPASQPLRLYQKVEVEDPVDRGNWDECTIEGVFQGAYEVMCNYRRSIRRDIHVRPQGGAPVAQTAALQASGPPFPRNAIVLASPLFLPDRWQLCIVLRNRIAEVGAYELRCAGSDYAVPPSVVRLDPDAPQVQ
jgi:hypothetical protein